MNFLNPFFLIGLTSTIIPLLIYLWSKRRKNEIEFSSLFLFRRIEASSIRSIKLTEWLLIVLRMLALVFFVLAFSQPFISEEKTEFLNKKYDQVLFDESPEFYFQNGVSRKQDIKSELIDFSRIYSKKYPDTRFFSTDSLSGYSFTQENDLSHSLFHSLPGNFDTSKSSLVVTKNPTAISGFLNGNSTDYLLLDEPSSGDNVGIVSVTFPDLIWQVTDANQVEISIRKSSLSEIKFGLEVWVDRQLIKTSFIEMASENLMVPIPVQVQSRGWHELKIKLNISDFPLDNEWNGGFYLPETVSADFKFNLSDVNFSPSSFQLAAESAGLKLNLNTDSGSGKSLLASSSFLGTSLSSLPAQYSGLIWIPDFKNEQSIRSQLSGFGFAVTQISKDKHLIKSLSNSTFWSFLVSKKIDLTNQPVTSGLVSLSPSSKIEFLAFNENNKPVLGLTYINEKPVLVFLTNPFEKSLQINVWAIGTVFHALSYLSQLRYSSGFSALTAEPGKKFFVDNISGKVTVELADKRFDIEPIGPFPYHLPEQSLFSTGIVAVSQNGSVIQKTGINYFARNSNISVSKTRTVLWKFPEPFPLLNNSANWELAAWFFALSLCCFVIESLVSRRKSKTVSGYPET